MTKSHKAINEALKKVYELRQNFGDGGDRGEGTYPHTVNVLIHFDEDPLEEEDIFTQGLRKTGVKFQKMNQLEMNGGAEYLVTLANESQDYAFAKFYIDHFDVDRDLLWDAVAAMPALTTTLNQVFSNRQRR